MIFLRCLNQTFRHKQACIRLAPRDGNDIFETSLEQDEDVSGVIVRVGCCEEQVFAWCGDIRATVNFAAVFS